MGGRAGVGQRIGELCDIGVRVGSGQGHHVDDVDQLAGLHPERGQDVGGHVRRLCHADAADHGEVERRLQGEDRIPCAEARLA
ncbi:hypothetical protein D9M69_468050 [compost metagenome]